MRKIISVLAIVGGSYGIFFALAQLTYRYPYIPLVVIGLSLIVLGCGIYRLIRAGKLFPAFFKHINQSKSQQSSTDYKNSRYPPAIKSNKYCNPFRTVVEVKGNPNEEPDNSNCRKYHSTTSKRDFIRRKEK